MIGNLIKTFAVFLQLVCLTQIEAQSTMQDALKVVLSKPDKPFKLTAGLQKGSISIVSYKGKEIVIEAELLPEKRDDSGPNQNQNINQNTNVNINEHTPSQTAIKITKGKYVVATESNNNVSIGPNNRAYSLRLLVKIPQTSNELKLSISGEGNIAVTDVTGEMEINNTNGSILLTNIIGSGVATTVTGNITASFKSVNEQSPMAFSTLTGKVDVSFPSSLKANLTMQSDDGSVYSDYEILFEGVTPTVAKVNTPCLYQVKSNESLTGKVNGGGPEILLKTMQGNVYVRKMK